MRTIFTTAAAAAILTLGMAGASEAKPAKKPAAAASLRGSEAKPTSKKGKSAKAEETKPAPEKTAAKGPVGKGPIKTDSSEPVTVKSGDSLVEVAQRTGVSRETLAKLNGLKPPYHLKPGQKLKLPERRYYAVQSGDTLLSVGRRVGADAKDLAEFNDLKSARNIRAGQKIYLPDGAEDTVKPEPKQAKASKTSKAAPEKKVAANADEKKAAAKSEKKKAAPERKVAAATPKPSPAAPKPGGPERETATASLNASAGRMAALTPPPSVPPSPSATTLGASATPNAGALAQAGTLDPTTGIEPRLVTAPPSLAPAAPASVAVAPAPNAATLAPASPPPTRLAAAAPPPASMGANTSLPLPSGATALPPPPPRPQQPQPQLATTPTPARPTTQQSATGFEMAPAARAPTQPAAAPPAAAPATRMAALTSPPQGRVNPRGYTEVGPSSTAPAPRSSGRPSELPPQIAAIAPANRAPVIIASAPMPAVTDVASLGRGRFIWPARGQILSPFGAKDVGQKNDGVNIAMREGDPVRAAAAGQVVYAGDQVPSFGNLVLVKHEGGWVTAYAHMGRITVKNNDMIAQGQQLGIGGQTGAVVQPQLHFEVRYAASPMDKAAPLDPMLVLPQ